MKYECASLLNDAGLTGKDVLTGVRAGREPRVPHLHSLSQDASQDGIEPAASQQSREAMLQHYISDDS